ncbi:MAG: lysophospholipase [Oscillospiraceae bacterium]|nr:lysophospholipase [Oscillospiraceae bacterium]
MSNFKDFYMKSADGALDIRVRKWTPDFDAVGTVQIAHGIAEHCERYDEFCEFLCKNGFAVYINDHRGHGKSVSDGKIGYFSKRDGWMKAVGDLHDIYELSAQEYPDVPHVLFGHSMGSFLARTYLFTYTDDFNGAVICGTAQMPSAIVVAGYTLASLISKFADDKPSALLDKVAFGSYNSGFKPPRTKFDWLSRDEAVVDKYIEDPMCGFVATAGLFRDMMYGLKLIGDKNNVAVMNKTTPVLFIAGDKDPVGENGKGVEKAYNAFKEAGLNDVSLKLYKDARHEVLNEINKYEVFEDILSWLLTKVIKEEI